MRWYIGLPLVVALSIVGESMNKIDGCAGGFTLTSYLGFMSLFGAGFVAGLVAPWGVLSNKKGAPSR